MDREEDENNERNDSKGSLFPYIRECSWFDSSKDNSWLREDIKFAEMFAKEAIIVRNVRKQYGKGTRVLDGLNMTVSRGSIYGLLGASGCGKSTLLTCVVGVRKVDSGDVWVLGGKPGSKGSGIPGPRVGYMPQEISLVGEFTVMGALYYFGRINGLDDETIEEKHTFLSNLLQLPPANCLVKYLSGGQQRRVSFAAALIHDPELLILDEPTVGLDPVLRDNIWNFLADITKTKGTTVVITTHYIEETKLANKIGLLRCGQLLAESSPSQLLAKFQCESLEDAFLKLSQRQKENQERGITTAEYFGDLEDVTISSSTQCAVTDNNNIQNEKASMEYEETEKRPTDLKSFAGQKFRALMTKNTLQFIRHPGGVLFALVLPIVQTFLFFYSIGGDLKGLHMAVVNNEAGNCNEGRYNGRVIYAPENYTCDYIDLSCRFLNGFNDAVAQNKFYDDIDEANAAVKHGEVVGSMYFGHNFSKALQDRRDDVRSATAEDIVAGEISISLDMGNRQIGLYVEKHLYDRFYEIYKDIIQECELPKKFGDLPLRFEDPIFGKMDQKYSSAMAPGFILTVVFFLATSVSSSIIIADRHEGIWDRSLVQGVRTAEILGAHLLTQLSVIVIQVTVTLAVSFLYFDLECRGSILTVLALVFFVGVCGLCYGFLISVMCTSHTVANYISTGSFYPVILLCGCIWPIEGMPRVLRWVSFTLPTTVPGIALRSLLDKGYEINDPQVYNGFLVISAWMAGLIALCFFHLRSKAA